MATLSLTAWRPSLATGICKPDCFNNNFGPGKWDLGWINLPCGADVLVHYYCRLADCDPSGTFYDVAIDSILVGPGTGGSCPFDTLIKQLETIYITHLNVMCNFPKIEPDSTCQSRYRLMASLCWKMTVQLGTHDIIDTISYCGDSTCCIKLFQICRKGDSLTASLITAWGSGTSCPQGCIFSCSN